MKSTQRTSYKEKGSKISGGIAGTKKTTVTGGLKSGSGKGSSAGSI